MTNLKTPKRQSFETVNIMMCKVCLTNYMPSAKKGKSIRRFTGDNSVRENINWHIEI